MFEETNWKTIGAEFMGTFFLVFIGLGAFGELGGGFEGALALGMTLMVLMHIFGPISGCHLNPAVTIGNMMSKKTSQEDAGLYIAGQTLGALVAWMALAGTFSVGPIENEMLTLATAVIGTAFFVMALLSTQDPWAVGGTLFLVTAMAGAGWSSGFADVNAGIDLGKFLADMGGADGDWYYGVIGSIVGAFAGWAIKENLLD